MIFAIVFMAVFAFVAWLLCYRKGVSSVPAFKFAFQNMLWIIPILFFALFGAGQLQLLLPPHKIAQWIGSEAGIRGILIGSFAGALAPGGPFVSFPLVAMMMKMGAGVGTLVAFISSWSLLAVNRIPLEVGIIGWKFIVVRVLCTFFFPPLAGLLAEFFFKDVFWTSS